MSHAPFGGSDTIRGLFTYFPRWPGTATALCLAQFRGSGAMYFKQFLHDETGCASYFLASRESREALVVDPQLDIQPYLDLATERGYRITHVVDTHLHADHISGNRPLARATGATLSLHKSADVAFECSLLDDGDEIRLGQLRLHVA